MKSLLLVLLLAASVPALADGTPVTRAEIDHAVETVKHDPNLDSERTVRTLHWTGKTEKEKKPRKPTQWPHWLTWLGSLFSWIGGASQMLMWLIIAALVALLAFFIFKVFVGENFRGVGRAFVPPTHVQDLDIRPESLPDDIGAAARALWDRGEQRAALALLYRGLLSRLAHVYAVPIRDSSTEGDCLRLATDKLDGERIDYVSRLVRNWQRAIYGGLSIETSVVHELCAQFDRHLARTATDESGPGAQLAGGAAA